jgi:uncharacterized OB-fold protein
VSDTHTERPLPVLTELTRPYWTSGADGLWRMQRCTSCGRLFHPPGLRCPHDHGLPDWAPLSGRGRVESWTINHHQFFPGFTPPYVIAFVTPAEDERVRVLTNLVNVDAGDITAGMAVRVTFERHRDGDDELFIPLFEPEL